MKDLSLSLISSLEEVGMAHTNNTTCRAKLSTDSFAFKTWTTVLVFLSHSLVEQIWEYQILNPKSKQCT